MTMHTAYIALGSNLGDRERHIESALEALQSSRDIQLVRTSRLIETEPVGPPNQGPYLNAAAELETSLSPRDLLFHLLEIERALGRDRSRSQRWGPRAIDLDLLLMGDQVIDEPGLTVPHPRLYERLFVLGPLAEIAPRAVHPLLGRTIQQLRDQCFERAGESRPSVSAATYHLDDVT